MTGGGTALAASASSGPVNNGEITGCYTNAAVNGSHALVLQNAGTTCPSGTSAISWNEQGPTGTTGPAGPTGATGPAGPTGATGPAGPTGAIGPAGSAGPAGAIGPAGPIGPAGQTGQTGAAGTNGNTILNGTDPPASSIGNNGDFYIDTATDVLYGPMAGGAWPATGVSLVGPQGSAGTPGANVFTSDGAPSGSTCTSGDSDIDYTTGDVYQCDSGAWSYTDYSLQGPAGSAGAGATVAQLSSGDTNCPSGGASITAGGSTAYACNGAASPPDVYYAYGLANVAGDTGTGSYVEPAQIGESYSPLPAGFYLVNGTVGINASVEGDAETAGCFAAVVASPPTVPYGPPFTDVGVADNALQGAYPAYAAIPVDNLVQVPSGGGEIGLYCGVGLAPSYDSTQFVAVITAMSVTDQS